MGSKINLQTEESCEQSEAGQYRKDIKKRNGMEPRMRKLVNLCIAAVVVFAALTFLPIPVIGALNWFPGNIMTPMEYSNALKANLGQLAYVISGVDVSSVSELSFGAKYGIGGMRIQLLQQVGGLAVGAGLAMVGAIFQGSFRNSIASPTTLGVMSGGTLASTIYVMWGTEWFGGKLENILDSKLGLTWAGHVVFVFVGCLAAVLFTTCLARAAGRGKTMTVTLIIVGMVFSGSCDTVSGFISYFVNMTDPYGEKATILQGAMAGRINESATWILVVFIGAMFAILQLMAKRMNLLVFGEDEARAMGVNVKRERMLVMGISTLITAVVIATCGGIAFLGLIIPHIARRTVGSDFRYLIPGCALIGGIFLIICNAIPQCDWMATYHVGNYCSMAGGVLYIYMILKNRRGRNADWA